MPKTNDLVDRILIFLHPPFKISRVDWLSLWDQRDRSLYKKMATRVWSVFLIVYVGHFFVVDIPLQKTPLELWAAYRFGLGACAAFSLYLINSKKNYFGTFYRVPSIIAALSFSYFQAQSMIWRAEVPYPYAIIIAVCGILSLNASMALSLVYLSLAYLVQVGAWLSRPNELPYIISAAAVGCIVIAVLRARLATDVDLFIAEQSQLETQKALIENQKELNEHIQAFLPRKIYRGFLDLVQNQRLSITQAMSEVLRPRYTLASCLYTDIRGFTQLVKKRDQFVTETILRSQRTFTDIVQDHDAIPRITGDLVFAIFENQNNPVKTITESFQCALDLIQKQADLNSSLQSSATIKRYVLISFGRALIGNTGGVDGSRDVAALGDCANILSRIDEVSKVKGIKEQISSKSIILTSEAAHLLLCVFPEIAHSRVILGDFGVALRDFPNETEVYIFDAEKVSRTSLMNPKVTNKVIQYLKTHYDNDSETELPEESVAA